MERQKGQSAVEFALIAPLIFSMLFCMIYGGIMFMDYLNYNNYARTIAREVSVATPATRDTLMGGYNKYKDQVAGIYNVSILVEFDNKEVPEDVIVNVDFKRNKSFMIIPENLKIRYRMKLENTSDTSDALNDSDNLGNPVGVL